MCLFGRVVDARLALAALHCCVERELLWEGAMMFMSNMKTRTGEDRFMEKGHK